MVVFGHRALRTLQVQSTEPTLSFGDLSLGRHRLSCASEHLYCHRLQSAEA